MLVVFEINFARGDGLLLLLHENTLVQILKVRKVKGETPSIFYDTTTIRERDCVMHLFTL